MEKLDMKISEARALDQVVDVGLTAVHETDFLLSLPGMLDSVKDGFAQSPLELARSLDW
jgi:hypothetical protein